MLRLPLGGGFVMPPALRAQHHFLKAVSLLSRAGGRDLLENRECARTERKEMEMEMRFLAAVILSIGLSSSLCFGAEKVELKDLKDKESYSLGYQFGQSLKAQGLDFNLEVYTAAIRDALAGTKPLLSQEEMQKTVSDLQKRVTMARQKELKEQAQKNISEGKAFLEANKKKEGVVTLPSGLQYKILKAGEGKKPTEADTVEVNYRGTLIDGTEFDSSYKRNQPATFPVKGIIKGWAEALQLMPVGSKWQLFIPPELAYGERGAGQAIGPNATLIFEVELLAIK
jgi:FKBP-type peptidyl-prolyl cis-trans isomerase FklB